ncbi:MAG: gliding motility protein GldN [Pedobacter sp.]|nr:gliding motility protein GldN [Pedobacter sp.]
MKRFLFLFLFLLAGLGAFAQNQTNPVPNAPAKVVPKKKAPKQDGFIFHEATAVDTVVPYAKVDTADIVYTKRVWREIDLRDRGNEILASPKINLVGIIYDAVNNGELDLYASDDESFKGQPISANKGNDPKATKSSTADTAFLGVNPGTNEVNRANNEFFTASFTTIRIKEDWILDIKRGIFEPRIIGIAPVRIDVKTAVDNNGNPVTDPATNAVRADTVKSVAGWIYFDDLREVLVKHKIANNQNDNSGINFDDVFVRRLFYSNVTKISNSADNRIEDVLFNPKERLLESERIKKAMADFEQGLWEY